MELGLYEIARSARRPGLMLNCHIVGPSAGLLALLTAFQFAACLGSLSLSIQHFHFPWKSLRVGIRNDTSWSRAIKRRSWMARQDAP
ncbi:hypothetical protein BDV11DRAFT_78397 [Aspergillus similis]